MKKIFSFTLCLAFIIAAAGCSASQPTTALDSPSPWGSSPVYERAEYAITRRDEIRGVDVATGALTVEVRDDHTGEDGTAYSRITMSSHIDYNDNAAEADSGKTDSVESEVVFRTASLSPQRSTKTVELADREGVTNLGYTLDNDYDARKSVITYADGRENTIEFGSAALVDVYDNEMLYYVARAISAVGANGSAAFNLASFYDMHSANSFYTLPMRLTCAESAHAESFPQLSAYLDDEQGSLSAITTNVAIGEKASGPPIELMFSLTRFKVAEDKYTSKVLLSIKTVEYDLSQSKIRYSTVYRLNAYSVTPDEN